MSETRASSSDANGPGIYEIRIKGHLDQRWSERLGGMALTLAGDGTTCLYGELADQAALHGVLSRIRDLGLELVSVIRRKPE